MTTKDKPPKPQWIWTGNPMPPIDLVLIAHCFKTFKVLKLVSAQPLINLPWICCDNLGRWVMTSPGIKTEFWGRGRPALSTNVIAAVFKGSVSVGEKKALWGN